MPDPVFGRSLDRGGSTYYISSTGDDSQSGETLQSSWRSIDRLNRQTLRPGDRVLFEGGEQFRGSIYLDEADAGTAQRPVIIGSYGNKRATILTASGFGLYAYEAAGIEVSNLVFKGSGPMTSKQPGISFYTERMKDKKLNHVVISGVSVSGYFEGISIGGWNGTAGFRNVRLSDVEVYDTQRLGILVFGERMYANRGVIVTRAHVYRVSGSPDARKNSGSGIVLGSVNGGRIEHSDAHDNGRRHGFDPEGPVGIWAYDSHDIVIEYNRSYSNRTGARTDGGGFDLDRNVTSSVLQYNRSYDNDGPGFLLFGAENARGRGNSGNVVRYNVSQNDGRKNRSAALQVYGPVRNASLHDNVVIASTSRTARSYAVRIQTKNPHAARKPANIAIHDNRFIGFPAERILALDTQPRRLSFQGNQSWCQTNGALSQVSSDDSLFDCEKAVPLGVSGGRVGLEILSPEDGAVLVEMVDDRGVDRH